jgi:anti-sigma regulatory factor (Ser/Thr protein kinase)
MVDFVAELAAKPDAISALTERAAQFLTEAGVDARAVHHVALVFDELLTNVATYGGIVEAPVFIRLTILPDRVTAEVLDGGMMFDPRVERYLDPPASVEDLPVGGWGLLLARRVTESLAYERVGSGIERFFRSAERRQAEALERKELVEDIRDRQSRSQFALATR